METPVLTLKLESLPGGETHGKSIFVTVFSGYPKDLRPAEGMESVAIENG